MKHMESRLYVDMSSCLHVQSYQQLTSSFLRQPLMVFAHNFILYNSSPVFCPFPQYAPGDLGKKESYCCND